MSTPTTLTPAQINALVSTCAPYLDGLGTSYGYVPSIAAGVVFVLLFGLSLLGHVVQAVRTRQSIFILCAVGAASESYMMAMAMDVEDRTSELMRNVPSQLRLSAGLAVSGLPNVLTMAYGTFHPTLPPPFPLPPPPPQPPTPSNPTKANSPSPPSNKSTTAAMPSGNSVPGPRVASL